LTRLCMNVYIDEKVNTILFRETKLSNGYAVLS